MCQGEQQQQQQQQMLHNQLMLQHSLMMLHSLPGNPFTCFSGFENASANQVSEAMCSLKARTVKGRLTPYNIRFKGQYALKVWEWKDASIIDPSRINVECSHCQILLMFTL